MKAKYLIIAAITILVVAVFSSKRLLSSSSEKDKLASEHKLNSSGNKNSTDSENKRKGNVREKLPPLIEDPENSNLTDLELKTLEFARGIQYGLISNEEKTLLELTDVNPHEWSAWIISKALLEHFTKKDNVFGSIEALELLRGSEADYLFQHVSAELLGEHSAKEDPEEIISFLKEDINRDIALRASHTTGAQMIMEKEDPESVMNKILQVDNEEFRQPLIDGALQQWEIQDRVGFAEYLNTIPADKQFDVAYESISQYIRATDFDADLAIEWGLNIQDPQIRHDVVALAAVKLSNQKPETFETWFETVEEVGLRDKIVEYLNLNKN